MRDRYAVIGNPVAHSQSPVIHAAFAQQTGQDLEYVRLLSPMDGFAATVRDFAASGGRGCNVTVPFKFEVPQMAQACSPRVALAQAANTLKFDGDRWIADNTDGLGLVGDIEQHAGWSLKGTTVLLLGAGGAAAGVLGPLIAARPRAVVVVNRTASSLEGAEVPVPAAVLRPGALVVDMMYGAKAQAFLDWAQAHGAQARDGLGMLVEQAAESFALWRGVRPQTAPVLEALRQQLLGSKG